MHLTDFVLDYDSCQTVDHHRRREFAQIEQYSRRELPRLVRRELELRVRRSYSTIEERLRSELIDIVRDCQSEVFRSYRQANDSSKSSTHSTDGSGIIQPSMPIFGSSTLEEAASFDLSPTIAPPPRPSARVEPLTSLTESLHIQPSSNSFSSSECNSSSEYIDSGNPYMYRHPTRANQRDLFLATSLETFDTFGAGHGLAPAFQSWQSSLNSFEVPGNIADDLPPVAEYTNAVQRSDEQPNPSFYEPFNKANLD
jgi:hypothetical protein